MDRRDFLHPRRLARSLGKIHGALEELRTLTEPAPTPQTEAFSLLCYSRVAMATSFEVVLPFGTPLAQQAAEDALDEIDRLEDQLTVYRDTSEVSSLNQKAATEEVVVEDRLFGLLELCARLWSDTERAFDVSVGSQLKKWGFFRRNAHIPEDTSHLLDSVGMQHVLLEPSRRSVRYDLPGLEINLGSIGKGYALDRAAERLHMSGLMSAVLHGGHSSITSLGHPPRDPRGWCVAIRDPWDSGRRVARVYLRDRALGTSAATFQHLEYNGRKLGHIIDPRTGWPAEGIASASVVAPSAAEADALATAFFILGVDKTRVYCARRPEISAVLLPEDGDPVVLGSDDIELTPLT
jgi:thiamine biosynthesis lipoprotein